KEQARRRVRVLGGLVSSQKVALGEVTSSPEGVPLRHERLPSQSEVDIQAPGDLESVLRIDSNVILPERHAVRLNLGERRRLSQHEIQHRILRDLAVERDGSIRIEKVEFIELQTAIVGAQRYLVPPVDDVDAVGELEDVAVEMRGGAITASEAKRAA